MEMELSLLEPINFLRIKSAPHVWPMLILVLPARPPARVSSCPAEDKEWDVCLLAAY